MILKVIVRRDEHDKNLQVITQNKLSKLSKLATHVSTTKISFELKGVGKVWTKVKWNMINNIIKIMILLTFNLSCLCINLLLCEMNFYFTVWSDKEFNVNVGKLNFLIQLMCLPTKWTVTNYMTNYFICTASRNLWVKTQSIETFRF